jgi:biopolymer transport protein ExbD
MTMNSSKSGAMSSEINVTPMIDVLLVLLIIFMVIVPALPKGEASLVPQPNHRQDLGGRTVVLQVLKLANGETSFRINETDVAKADLLPKLTAIYANRAERVLFVKGDDELSFTQIAEAIDIGHAAGIDHVGMMTPKVLAGL